MMRSLLLLTALAIGGAPLSARAQQATVPVSRGWPLDRDAQVKVFNPNGRIPTIVDRDEGNFAVFESGAILLYLAEKTGRFLPADPVQRAICWQWLMFQVSGVGPMFGQEAHFTHYAKDRHDYAIAPPAPTLLDWVAGAGRDDIFSADTTKKIFEYTGGIPRLINTLCDTAMTCAYADSVESVNNEVIAAAVEEKLGA